jgi:hypothetical protein
MSCASEPILGGELQLTYQSPSGIGFMVASPECSSTGVDVIPPLVCAPGRLYPEFGTVLLFGVLGNPARFTVRIPNEVALLGHPFCFQGTAVEAPGCLRLTQGIRVLVTRPYR